MDVTWHGQASFTIKGSNATVVTDPFGDIGLKQPKWAADLVLVSHGHFDHNEVSAVHGEPHVIELPGEYEYAGVMVEGLPTYHDDKEGTERGSNIVFSFTVDGIHFVHCGDLGHQLSDDQVEQLGDVDVLMVPVGGNYTIDAKGAAEVVKQLQPRVTVPMHYLVPGLKVEIAGVEDFLKQVGGKQINLENSTWKLKNADLPDDESQIVVFPNP